MNGQYPAGSDYSKHANISLSASPKWTGITSFPGIRQIERVYSISQFGKTVFLKLLKTLSTHLTC